MRFHRPLLYAGVFLVALGAVGLAADAGYADTSTLTWIVRLWPLAIIGIGLALVLRRTPLALAGGLVAAVMPGLLVGSAFAVVPRFAGDCGAGGAGGQVVTDAGRLSAPGHVAVSTGCGVLTVGTVPGDAWQLQASSTDGHRPVIDASDGVLGIREDRRDWDDTAGVRSDWNLMLPMGRYLDMAFIVNAGEGRLALGGTSIADLELVANLSAVEIDLSTATVESLRVIANTSDVSIRLPGGQDFTASLRANAAAIEVCTPEGVGFLVRTGGGPRQVTVDGREFTGRDYVSADYATATNHIELVANVSVGSIDINPIGGC